MKHPDYIEEEFLEYLDELRNDGWVNMVDAGPYLQEEFGLDRHKAKQVLRYWINTFGERHLKNKGWV